MKLETKRALLMYKLLSSRDFCPETYKILKFCDLDDAINNICLLYTSDAADE